MSPVYNVPCFANGNEKISVKSMSGDMPRFFNSVAVQQGSDFGIFLKEDPCYVVVLLLVDPGIVWYNLQIACS
ncbi:MAG: hypothetical protein DSY70_08860 [Desulfobulbus sp.]|nr:MAG: hypothetical protein DSY70_08860 [Desulfobulbus sp.]